MLLTAESSLWPRILSLTKSLWITEFKEKFKDVITLILGTCECYLL